MNFVFIGSFQDSDIEEFASINFCGNILTIYEKTDIYGVTAIERKKTSKLKIKKFKEIELNTGLKHGFYILLQMNGLIHVKSGQNKTMI